MPTRIDERRAGTFAGYSALVPGLGQWLGGRRAAALIQFGTCAAYLGAFLAHGSYHALWGALAWNVWSAIDAYMHRTD